MRVLSWSVQSRCTWLIPAAFVCVLPLVAAEPDALAISANIQARHVPYGVIMDPVFASPSSDDIIGYSRAGDSAIWTGHYLAAEAFRYAVTKSPDALANARRALDGIRALHDVTGDNFIARSLFPADSPYAQGISDEEAQHRIYLNATHDQQWLWVGNTSRDQYSGVFFGLAVAYDLIDDAAMRASIRDLTTLLLEYLRDNSWIVVMPDGHISTTFIGREDQQLSLLQVGRHVNPKRFSTIYDLNRVFLSAAVLAPISIEVLDDSSYFKFNLDTINLFNLVRLESSSWNVVYKKAYDILRKHTDNHGNAFFNMIDRALRGPDAVRDQETRDLLDQWLQRPRRDEWTDLRGVYPACGNEDTACDPIPVVERVRTDFLWQRSPFQLTGGGEDKIETAGIDYILPYWMARYYGVIAW